MNTFKLRIYRPTDLSEIAQLFYQTVHMINCRDYSPEQINAWADGQLDRASWQQSLQAHQTVLAVLPTGKIIGFGDLSQAGYFDRLYVHADYQRQGVATAICNYLEANFGGSQITTQASLTAQPFFTRRGYQIQRRQQVLRHQIKLTNFVMIKNLAEGRQ